MQILIEMKKTEVFLLLRSMTKDLLQRRSDNRKWEIRMEKRCNKATPEIEQPSSWMGTWLFSA